MPPEAHGEEIKRMWRLNGEHKSSLGTVMHRQIELYLNRAPHDASGAEFAQFLAWEEEYPQMLPVRTEMNLWAEDLQLAGQLDALFWSISDKEFILVDFKRVEKLEMDAKDGKWGKPPFQTVSNTNWGHYVVQQNVYAAMLDQYYGVPVAKMYLLVLHPNHRSFEFVQVPDVRRQVDVAFAERRIEVAGFLL